MNNLKLNPVMRSVVNRTRQAGLHKVARVLHGHEIDLGSVVQKLGHDLTLHHQKHARVRDGIRALGELHNQGIVAIEKQAFITGLGKSIAKGWGALGRAGERAGASLAQQPVMQRAGRIDGAISGMPGLNSAQRGAMTQQWLPATEKAMAEAGQRGGAIGKHVAQLGTVGAAGLGAGALMRGGGNNKQAGVGDFARNSWDALGDAGQTMGSRMAANRAAAGPMGAQAAQLEEALNLAAQHGADPAKLRALASHAEDPIWDAIRSGGATGRNVAQYGTAGLGAGALGGAGYAGYNALQDDAGE